MSEASEALRGSCLCGQVRYRLTGPLGSMGHCHCVDCRKAHGAAFATFLDVPRSGFTLTEGADLLRYHRADTGAVRSFCRDCGSTLFWERGGDSVDIAAGTLDTPPTQRPSYHFFVRSKVPWYDIQDGLPQHAAYPEEEE
jgi:hypothetical protein